MKAIFKYVLLILTIALFGMCSSNTDKTGHGNHKVQQVSPDDSVPEVRPRRIRADDIKFVKDLRYDKYTLDDVYPYGDGARRFQWNKIRNHLVAIENSSRYGTTFGVIQNRNNTNGEAALASEWETNAYGNIADMYGIEKYQSAPLYALGDTITPVRYLTDGSLIRTDQEKGSFTRIFSVYLDSEWYTPTRFLKKLDIGHFGHIIFIDVTNQNICTLERSDSTWIIRSMNPATTGIHNPPYAQATPLGIFVIQEKKPKMYYLVDGSSRLAGYAPWASRFSNGGYIHGVPTNDPKGEIIEYGWTLGTTPRSHMCVRTASSHAKFIYDWAPREKSLVVVIE